MYAMKTYLRRHLVPAVGMCLLLAAFTIAGCGGGSNSGSTTQAGGSEATTNAGTGSSPESEEGSSAAESREEQLAIESGAKRKQGFLAKAETLCREQQKIMQTRAGALFNQAKPHPSAEASQRALVEEVIAPGFEAEAEGLRALEAPKGDEKEVEALIAAIDKSAVEGREDPKAYLANERFAKADDLARRYGLLACGNFEP